MLRRLAPLPATAYAGQYRVEPGYRATTAPPDGVSVTRKRPSASVVAEGGCKGAARGIRTALVCALNREPDWLTRERSLSQQPARDFPRGRRELEPCPRAPVSKDQVRERPPRLRQHAVRPVMPRLEYGVVGMATLRLVQLESLLRFGEPRGVVGAVVVTEVDDAERNASRLRVLFKLARALRPARQPVLNVEMHEGEVL